MVALADDREGRRNGSGGDRNRPGLLRQFKILVMALTLSNIVLGLFGFLLLREIDQKYSALVSQAVPSLNDLQGLTTTIVQAMHSTNPTVYPDAMEDRAGTAKQAERI